MDFSLDFSLEPAPFPTWNYQSCWWEFVSFPCFHMPCYACCLTSPTTIASLLFYGEDLLVSHPTHYLLIPAIPQQVARIIDLCETQAFVCFQWSTFLYWVRYWFYVNTKPLGSSSYILLSTLEILTVLRQSKVRDVALVSGSLPILLSRLGIPYDLSLSHLFFKS